MRPPLEAVTPRGIPQSLANPARQLVASDRFACRQIVGHIEVMTQRRKRLVRPILQLRIVAAFGVALE